MADSAGVYLEDMRIEELPIFPLPGVVLMPGAILPLHVFEPRYRSLIGHCMETDRTLGLATLKAGYENTYHGNPPIHSIVGVGRIVSFQQLYDGRSNIIVQSIGQAEMVRELSSNEPFRQIECIMRGGKLDKLGSGMGTIRSLVMQVGTLSSEACQEAQRLLEMDSLLLLDVLARKLLDTTADRLRYMAAQHVGVRMDLVRGALADLLVTEMSERASA